MAKSYDLKLFILLIVIIIIAAYLHFCNNPKIIDVIDVQTPIIKQDSLTVSFTDSSTGQPVALVIKEDDGEMVVDEVASINIDLLKNYRVDLTTTTDWLSPIRAGAIYNTKESEIRPTLAYTVLVIAKHIEIAPYIDTEDIGVMAGYRTRNIVIGVGINTHKEINAAITVKLF